MKLQQLIKHNAIIIKHNANKQAFVHIMPLELIINLLEPTIMNIKRSNVHHHHKIEFSS